MNTIKPSFLKVILLIFVYSLLNSVSFSQSCYHPFVDSIISQVTLSSISKFNCELTGDTSTTIGGLPYTIISRYWESPSNQKAAQYIFEKFQSYGLETQLWVFSATGTNVIGKKTGVRFPNQKIIICGHYDDIIMGFVPDTTHGADDDASGTSAVLEAARILSQYSWDYTIIFAAWDEEERYLFGSDAYADTAHAHGDSIVAVINLDMIAWDNNNDNKLRVGSDTNSLYYVDLMVSSMYIYEPSLNPWKSGPGSDEISFLIRGYKGILVIEDTYPDFNFYYHTVDDNFLHLNKPYFLKLTKSAIAALVVLQKDYVINFDHSPLESTNDTAARVASVVITSNHKLVKSP